MHFYRKEAKEILEHIIELTLSQNKNSVALKQLYQQIDSANQTVIDCAHKLAPYQTPKLESIEVRNKIEHKFVLRAPQQVKSVDEWMKTTGAEKLAPEEVIVKKAPEASKPIESIHNYDMDEDEITTQKQLH